MMGQSAEPLYSRVQNPTVSAFEQMMADLEGGEAAVAFASGMGAISATVLALARPGASCRWWRQPSPPPRLANPAFLGLRHLSLALSI